MKKSVLSCGLAIVALALLVLSTGAFAFDPSSPPKLTFSDATNLPKGNFGGVINAITCSGYAYYLGEHRQLSVPIRISGENFSGDIREISITSSPGVVVDPGDLGLPMSVDQGGTWSKDLALTVTPPANSADITLAVTVSDDNAPVNSASAKFLLYLVSADLSFTPDSNMVMTFLKPGDVRGQKVSLQTKYLVPGPRSDLEYAIDGLQLARETSTDNVPVSSNSDPWGSNASGLIATIGNATISFDVSEDVTTSGDLTLQPRTLFYVYTDKPITVSSDNDAIVAGTGDTTDTLLGRFNAEIVASQDLTVHLVPDSITGYTGIPMNEKIEVLAPDTVSLDKIEQVTPNYEWNGLTPTIDRAPTPPCIYLKGTPKAEGSQNYIVQVCLKGGTTQKVTLPVTIEKPAAEPIVSTASADWTGTVNGNGFTMTTSLLLSPSVQKKLNALRLAGDNIATFVTPEAVSSSSVSVSEDQKTVTIRGTIADGYNASDVVLKSLSLTLNGTVYTQDNINLALTDTERHSDGGGDSSSGCNVAGAGLLFSVLPLLLISKGRRA